MMSKVLMLCLLLGSAVPSFAQQPAPLSAKQILDKMVSVYASCNSYADKGESRAVFLDSGRVSIRPFSTAFIRPSQFRFEFQDESQLRSTDYVVWWGGASAKNWWSILPDVRSFETLDLALAAAAGVSGTSSILVPSMLFGDFHTHMIQTLSQLVLLNEETAGGRPAYKIKGMDSRNHELTIWIDKEKFLLLKTFASVRLPNTTAEQTITYQPEINTTIPAEKLAFKH